MFIDIVGLVLVLMAFLKGYRHGLVMALFSFLAFLIGLAAALKLSAAAAGFLGSEANLSGRWLPFAAFALVFLLVTLLVKLGARMLQAALQLAMLGWLNRLAGFFFYALIYLFIWSILLFYAAKMSLIRPETLSLSLTYPLIRPLAPHLMEATGYILPFFRNVFSDLEHFFGHLSHQVAAA